MPETQQLVPVKEKVGYAMGDIATNFFFQSMILYQTRFYTDTAGISAGAVSYMFLVLRLADAVVDPFVGGLSDRTQTRWGKFRPWIFWTALPFGLIFWLVYVTPDFGPSARLVYAYITYTLLMMMYSANNTPYSALMGVMTPDSSERSSIASYRFVGALIGQFIIQALPLPLVAKLGQGNSAKGWGITMAIFGSLIVVLNLITFFSTQERVQPPPGGKHSIVADIKDVFSCGPWIVMFVLTLLVFTMLVVRGSSSNYLFAYYLDQGQIREFLGKFGLAEGANASGLWSSTLNSFGLLIKPDGSNAAAVAFSLSFVVGSLVQIVGIIFSKPLADRFGKKTVFIAGVAVTTIATAWVFWATPSSIAMLFWLSILWAVGWGPTVPLLWVMIADVADYSEWKNHRRATGFMFAGILFALKAGLGLGGWLSAQILDFYGYIPNVIQTERSLLGIRLGASIFPSIALTLVVVCLFVYPIGKSLNRKIQEDLTERRKTYATLNAQATGS
ncbi:MAG TPA: MFS transporter [Terriglobales bacterium]|jgi:Na+/melibiose symporter-like transporter|nr:MFS transporter [Terriglobales bacterium]